MKLKVETNKTAEVELVLTKHIDHDVEEPTADPLNDAFIGDSEEDEIPTDPLNEGFIDPAASAEDSFVYKPGLFDADGE